MRLLPPRMPRLYNTKKNLHDPVLEYLSTWTGMLTFMKIGTFLLKIGTPLFTIGTSLLTASAFSFRGAADNGAYYYFFK